MGREVIAESQLILELKVTAFLDRLPVDLSPAAKRKAAERLVDQTLILQESAESRLELPAPDPVALVNQVKILYPSEAQYRADLERYGITEPELSAHLVAGMQTLTFADLRFRAAAQVSEEALHDYYDKITKARQIMTPPHLLNNGENKGQNDSGQPQSVKAASDRVPTFDESRAEIETLLAGQKSLDALDEWLKTSRAAARIEFHERAFASEPAPLP
ncbi:MAG: hypothetical protein ABI824_00675 [Acidobacteriota bacterium]